MRALQAFSRALRAAADGLDSFAVRRAALRAFREMARRNPTLAAALLLTSSGDRGDAADSWARILELANQPVAVVENSQTLAATRWANEVALTRFLRAALRKYSPAERIAQA